MSILDLSGSRVRRKRAARTFVRPDISTNTALQTRRTSHLWDKLVLGGMASGGCMFWAGATAAHSHLAPGLWASMGVLGGLLVTGYGLTTAEGLVSRIRAFRTAAQDGLRRVGSNAA